MNAKFLEKIIYYRQNNDINFYKTILKQKIKNQFYLIRKREYGNNFIKEIDLENEIQRLSLIEARAAKIYWKFFREKIKLEFDFKNRNYKNKDYVNQLLNIGYNYLSNKIYLKFKELDIPVEIGLFHKAQTKKSRPLVYDFMEWLRPILVDKNLLSFLNKKKKVSNDLSSKEIRKFLYIIKENLNKKYYNRNLKYCVSLDYFITLTIQSFIECVNKNNKYKSLFPSMRNENRCKNKKPLNSGL